MTFRATILTLFPDMFPGPLGLSLAGDALARGLWALEARNIREHGLGKHRTVDDTPAGGGAGMVLRADVLAAAIDAAAPAGDPRPRLLMSPRGKPLTQARVRELAEGPGALIVCGRFEGVDERVIEGRQLEEISIGDYVLSGGEIAALALLDACVRLIPGVMGAADSGAEESFENGLLEYPHFTRPREWEGRNIPEIVLSGDHKKIAEWRQRKAQEITRQTRPDIWLAAGFPTYPASVSDHGAIIEEIPGGSALIKWASGVPTFHDAEVVSLELDRAGSKALTLKVFGKRGEALVTFEFDGWIDAEIAGFSHQNVIYHLAIRRAHPREIKSWDVGVGCTPGEHILELAPCFGAFGRIRASIARIRMGSCQSD